MKKILYFALSLSLLSSCDMDLGQQPISEPGVETFFQSENDFNQGLTAIYNPLRNYPERLMNLSETRSDNLFAVSDGGVRDWEGVNSFHRILAANPYVEDAWETNFNGIFRANNYLEQLAAKGESVILDADQRMHLEGEVRFLRAFYYFDLIRYFGKVPLIDHVVTAEEGKTIPRSPVSELYNLIIEDLNTAINYLPAHEEYSAEDAGRASKQSAQMLLGLVYMTRSGPDLGVEGAGLNTNEWDKAVEQFNAVIASKAFELLPKYADIFSYTNEHNKEVIFNIEYSSGSNPAVGASFPWLLVPDTWFRSLGFGNQGGLQIRPVSKDFMNTFEEGDVRRAFSIQEGYRDGTTYESRPFVKKFVDITRVPTTSRTDWPINYIVFRYTDLLLLKAECVLNGAPGSTTADVDDVVNAIRERAGLKTKLTGVTKAQLLDERRREFIGEGTRWFDLIRSGTVESTMKSWIDAEDAGGQMRDFDINYVLYPVPQSELNTAPGLYEQNPGY